MIEGIRVEKVSRKPRFRPSKEEKDYSQKGVFLFAKKYCFQYLLDIKVTWKTCQKAK